MNITPGTHLLTVPIPGNAMPAVVSTGDNEELYDPSVTRLTNLRTALTSIFGQKLCMIELPETIAVETRFITKAAAKQASIVTVCDLQTPPYSKQEIKQSSEETKDTKLTFDNPTLTSTKTYKDQYVSAQPSVTEVGIITNGPPPQRNRSLQTEEIVTQSSSIGIQCDLEFDLQFEMTTDPDIEIRDSENVKEKFQSFLKQQTRGYSNGKLECLVCGEFDRNVALMERHMALHWGPAVLCWCCGVQFEHESLLRHHQCIKERAKKRKKNELYCPHFRCGVSVISALELYDHLNEHAKLRPHKCSYCKKRFATVGEQKQHCMFRLRCYCARRRHYPYMPFKSQQERLYRTRVYIAYSRRKCAVVKRKLVRKAKRMQRCQFCLWRCRDLRTFSQHNNKCLQRFLARSKRKPEAPTTPSNDINGH